MAINATSSPCLRCGIGPGRPHIDGCPLDALLEAVTPRADGPSPLLLPATPKAAGTAPTIQPMPR